MKEDTLSFEMMHPVRGLSKRQSESVIVEQRMKQPTTHFKFNLFNKTVTNSRFVYTSAKAQTRFARFPI